MSIVGACQREPELDEISANVDPAPAPTPASDDLADSPSPPSALTCGGANITAPWGTTPFLVGSSSNEVLVEVAPHPTQAMTGRTFSRVYSIQGPTTFTFMAGGDRAVLDRASGRFGVREDDEFRIYSPAGAVTGELAGLEPFQYFKFFPGAQRVFAPKVEQTGLHSMQVDATEVLDLDGDVLDSFNTTKLLTSRLSPSHLFYSNGDDLIQATLDGTQVWSIAGALVDFRVSHGSTPQVIARSAGSGQIWHAHSGASSYNTASITGVPWNMAISPDGAWSAATTFVDGPTAKFNNLYLFTSGALRWTLGLPVPYAVSLDVNDDGELLVGAQDSQNKPVVFLFDITTGDCLWSWSGDRDWPHAHRPAVQFLGTDDRFVVLMSSGAVLFENEGV